MQTLVDATSTLSAGLQALSSPVISALQGASALVSGGANPSLIALNATYSTVLSAIENLKRGNLHFMVITPFTPGSGATFDPFFEIPILRPATLLETLNHSFEDQGDANRPEYGQSASVGAFVNVVASSSVADFLVLVAAMGNFFDLAELQALAQQIEAILGQSHPASHPTDGANPTLNRPRQIGRLQRR